MPRRTFRERIEASSRKRGSNIVLALDLEYADSNVLLSKSLEILEDVSPYVCAVKVNHHLVLPLGLYDGVKKVIAAAHALGLPAIMDCKINDIGHTNEVIANHYFDAGFDAVIANPFVGWEEGLAPVFKIAEMRGKGVILLTYMSHRGASEGYGQKVLNGSGLERYQYLVFAKKALMWGADGVIVGATYPERIQEIRSILKGKVPIYAPGVGAQGGDIKQTLEAGANYLIIGRSIVSDENPVRSARLFWEAVKTHRKSVPG